jgi:hypothetical protein
LVSHIFFECFLAKFSCSALRKMLGVRGIHHISLNSLH